MGQSLNQGQSRKQRQSRAKSPIQKIRGALYVHQTAGRRPPVFGMFAHPAQPYGTKEATLEIEPQFYSMEELPRDLIQEIELLSVC